MDVVVRQALSAEAIIGAAERLVDGTGATRWSIRALSRVLDCTPGALYRHFPGGAAEIAAELRCRDLVRLEDRLAAAEADVTAPGLGCLPPRSHAARLIRRCRAYLDFATDQPAVYGYLFGTDARLDAEPESAPLPVNGAIDPAADDQPAERLMIETTAILIRAAARARELGRPVIGTDEAARLATLIWVQLHGFADLRLRGVATARLAALETRLLVNLLAVAEFAVAATPVGLEAAAKAADRAARATPSTPTLPSPSPVAHFRTSRAARRDRA